MDATDRQLRIEQLQRANAASLAELEQREWRREMDPFVEQEQLFAEAQPVGGAPVSETNDRGILYRRYDGDAPARALQASSDTDFSGWERWMEGHLANERAEVLDVVSKAMGEVVVTIRQERESALRDRDRKLADLQAENHELRSMLGDVLKRIDALAADVETAREAREASTALVVRLARLEGLFQGKMSHLIGLADAAGMLPRGYE
jgi:hypothetical protein